MIFQNWKNLFSFQMLAVFSLAVAANRSRERPVHCYIKFLFKEEKKRENVIFLSTHIGVSRSIRIDVYFGSSAFQP